jgi:hypothetical protein
MTKEELIAERSWLVKKKNKSHPDFDSRLLAFNQEVEAYNSVINQKDKEAAKGLKVGDIVHVREDFNYKGLWRVEKIMRKNVLLKAMTENQKSQRLRCSAGLVTKVEGEDESLLNSLDLIGLV